MSNALKHSYWRDSVPGFCVLLSATRSRTPPPPVRPSGLNDIASQCLVGSYHIAQHHNCNNLQCVAGNSSELKTSSGGLAHQSEGLIGARCPGRFCSRARWVTDKPVFSRKRKDCFENQISCKSRRKLDLEWGVLIYKFMGKCYRLWLICAGL